jgi:4-hydroxy-tetrahydrodipicolinate synthase
MQELIGTGVALITPFNASGAVDVQGLENLVNHQIANGIDYLVVLGTTGESVTLTKEEKKLVVTTVKKANAARIPLVIGIGGSDTAVIVDEIRNFNYDGFTAVLSVSPAYNKPSQEGIYQHFKAVAQATTMPIIIYNVPGRTGSNISVETVVRLSHDFENIVALKEAAGDIVQAMKMIQYTPKEFLVISGDDMIALAMTLAGGAGVISVIGMGLPQDFSDMIRYGLNGDVDEAFELHYKAAAAIDMIFEQGNPCGIKEMLMLQGICGNNVRLPLVAVNEDLSTRLKKFLETYHIED